MEELATLKSALPSVVMHSGALDPHSLFWTMYVPPATRAVWNWQSVVVAASATVAPETSAPAPATVVTTAVASARTCLYAFIRPPVSPSDSTFPSVESALSADGTG